MRERPRRASEGPMPFTCPPVLSAMREREPTLKRPKAAPKRGNAAIGRMGKRKAERPTRR